ncbi:MAG: SH3 domain-containing protein [Shimia sp.]
MVVKLVKAFALVGAFVAANIAAAQDYTYDHNGSEMRVSVRGADVTITYTTPRSGLRGLGVRSGTLLFEGRASGGTLDGMTRLFHSNCGEVDYYVYGEFTPGRDFRLSGAAPVLSGMSCRIVDNVYDGPNANLLFTALRAATPLQSPRAGCLRNVRSSLNVRVGPGTEYPRIAELPAGTCGIRVENDECRDGWCLIRQGATLGWISAEYFTR